MYGMPKMCQNTFGGWALPRPTGGAEALPQTLLATMRGPTSKGKGKGGREGREGTGKEGGK